MTKYKTFWDQLQIPQNKYLFVSAIQISKIGLNSHDLLLKNVFEEKQNNRQTSIKWIQKEIYLYKQYLVVYNTNDDLQQIDKMIKLDLVNCNWTTTNDNYSITFYKNRQQFEIRTTDFSTFSKWKKILRSLVFLSDFHEEYKGVKLIGQGAFSKVFMIRRKKDKKIFAAKILKKKKILKRKNGINAIFQEIQILRHLGKERKILSLEEVQETTSSIYIIMEYSPGQMLFDVLIQQGIFKENNLKLMMKSILLGLDSLHSKGVIHRDLKLDNIIQQKKNSYSDLRIIDFGLSEFVDNKNPFLKKCGTPGYIAPENFKDENEYSFTTKSDIYQAGIIFFILFTGKSPFYSKNIMEILEMNKNNEIDFQHLREKNASDDFLDLIKQLLNKEPENRPSAREALNHNFFRNMVITTKNQLNSPISILESNSLLSYENNLQQKLSIKTKICEVQNIDRG